MVTQPKLFALNALLLVSLLLQLSIGIWLFLISRGLVLDSALKWINLHVTNGLILVSLVMIHLYMNRKWIGLQLKRSQSGKKTAVRSRKTKKSK